MNLNKAFLIGRLTADPETRTTPSGQMVATIRLATNRVWNDPTAGRKEATEFHQIVAWGRLAEIAGQYLKKGGLVMIEGRIQTRSWTDQSNNKRWTTEIVAENLQMGPRSASSGFSGQGGGSNYEAPARSNSSNNSNSNSAPASRSNDDIPIIDENEPVSHGMDEDTVSIKDKDLPF